MKHNHAPLMAAAMAGILAPIADASIISEPPDFSNNFDTPADLGAFNPASDAILGSIDSVGDYRDYIRVTGSTPGPISIPISILGAAHPSFTFDVYSEDPAAWITGIYLSSPSGTANGTLDFTVPANGNYVMGLSFETSGTTSYTIGTVPEPTSAALLALGLAGAGLKRRREKTA